MEATNKGMVLCITFCPTNAPAQPRRAHAHGEITPHLTPADGCSGWLGLAPLRTSTSLAHEENDAGVDTTVLGSELAGRSREGPCEPVGGHNSNLLEPLGNQGVSLLTLRP